MLAVIVDKLFPEFKSRLEQPKSTLNIPVEKTIHVPARAMRSKVCTNDRNIEVLNDMMKQMGLDCGTVDKCVVLMSGDLGVIERIVAIWQSHRIEFNLSECLQFVIVMIGLFHVKMACMDAFWRTYIQPTAICDFGGAIYQYMEMLNPKQKQKMMGSPTFRMLPRLSTTLPMDHSEPWETDQTRTRIRFPTDPHIRVTHSR